jgi:hypothetical protein
VPASSAKNRSFPAKELLSRTVIINKINRRRDLIVFVCNNPATFHTSIGGSASGIVFYTIP